MRRMRSIVRSLVFAIPAIVAVIGVRYIVMNNGGVHEPGELISEDIQMKPSQLHYNLSAKPPVARTIAQAPSTKVRTQPAPEIQPIQPIQAEPAKVEASSPDSLCKTVEYPGDGANGVVTSEDWEKVLLQFHSVKVSLMGWLEQQKSTLSEETVSQMESQLIQLRIQRPPAPEEKDLAWRGIGVYTRDGAPLIRVGSGFVKWVQREPMRAKFELARLAAQAWAPCELAKVQVTSPWTSLTQCLGVNEESCAAGGYSEAGWAVSSAIAYTLSNPGCKLPAFTDATASSCLGHLVTGGFADKTYRKVASGE